MIELQQVTKVFNPGTPNENVAIRNLNIAIEPGDFITIIGSNGAGKSTLFNLIGGTIAPTMGQVFVRERDVTREAEFKRSRYIGRIFQDPLLGTAGNMSLEHNMMICAYKGMKSLKINLNSKRRQYFREHLVELKMGLEDRLKDNVGLLSGGQRQALTLLMMVLSRPELILLDEHTAALDPHNAELVMELTQRFINEYKLTTMMITHNMQQALQFGNRLIMMDAGEIILDVSGEEKANLSVPALIERFRQIRHQDIDNDELLLS
ncbi:ABC transporter ATP-binding protein [Spirochaeta dissipatitropha]